MQKKNHFPYMMGLIILVIFLILCSRHYRPAPKWVDWRSIEIASSLVDQQVFTDGGTSRNKVPGYFFSPGYPTIIATLAKLVPSVQDNLRCLASKHRNCRQNSLFKLIIATQIAAALLTLFLVFMIARNLSHSTEIAILTLLLFLFSGGLTKFSLSVLPFVFTSLLITASCYLLLRTYRQNSLLYALCTGLSCGLAALFYPPFALAPLFIAITLFFAMRRQKSRAGLSALAILTGAAIILSPWLIRNSLIFGEIAIDQGSSIRLLAMRVAYNNLSLNELLASFILWMPNFGIRLGELMFSIETVEKLGTGKNSYFVSYSNIINDPQIQGHNGAQYSKIISKYIFGDLFHYIISLPGLFLRGFWGGSTIGIIGTFFLWPLQKRLRASRDIMPFGLVFFALIGWVLTQAMLVGAPNPHQFNGQVVFIHAYAIAHMTGGLELPKFLRLPHGQAHSI